MKKHDIMRAKKLHDDGLALREIGNILGVSRTTVLNYFRETGYKNRSIDQSRVNASKNGKYTIHRVGKKYGSLKVTGLNREGKRGRWWDCVCECGNKIVVHSSSLNGGISISCGSMSCDGRFKHGMSLTPVYKVWIGIVQRCTDKNYTYYHNYGGRGIKVCDRWLNSFDDFYSDMGDIPNGMTIERKDNNKGYSKDNCKWATWTEQNNNKRSNINIKIGENTKTVTQWAKHLGINKSTIYSRVRLGWGIKDAITIPIAHRKNKEKNKESK